MRKYEIYLPLGYNDGTEIEAEKIKQIREELIPPINADADARLVKNG
jgi:hypothetical protein